APCRPAQFDDRPRRGHILGQVEIMDAGAVRGVRDRQVHLVWQAGEYRLGLAADVVDSAGFAEIDTRDRERQVLAGRNTIVAGNVEADVVEHTRGKRADLAEPQDDNPSEHAGLLKPRLNPPAGPAG